MAAGLAALAVGPVIALGHGGHPALTATTSTSARPDAVPVERMVYLPPRDAVAELRAPDPTPTPTPAPTPAPTHPALRPAVATPVPLPPPSAGTIEAIIYAAATKYGVSYAWMLKIARCESSLNPRAYNPAGPYIGLFQFLPSTFRAHGGTDIYDPVQQANITADMLAHGQARAWGCA